MAKKPWSYDAFEHLKPPLWMAAEDRIGRVIEFSAIDINSDPRGALVNAMANWVNRGWKLEPFSGRDASFYCNKDGERRFVHITSNDPSRAKQFTKQL